MRRYVAAPRKSAFREAIEEAKRPGGVPLPGAESKRASARAAFKAAAYPSSADLNARIAAVQRQAATGFPVAITPDLPAAAGECLLGWVGPLWCAGKPQPKGSTRSFFNKGRLVTTSDNAKVAPWAKAIGVAFLAAGGQRPAPSRIAEVRMRFYLERPMRHFQANDPTRPLREDVPLYPGRKPDLDKLERAVLDALAGLAYEDDGAVVRIDAAKDFCARHEPGVLLWWRYLPGPVFKSGDSGS